MEDKEIIDLYFARAESAIAKTRDKYSRYIKKIAYNVLRVAEEAEECENDTYFKAWNTIPPERPAIFSVYLGRISRNLALDMWRSNHADKRGNGEVPALIDELEECLEGDEMPENKALNDELTEILNSFLGKIKENDRNFFVRRYFYGETVSEVAKFYKSSESRVKMSLKRTRDKLRERLEREGYYYG